MWSVNSCLFILFAANFAPVALAVALPANMSGSVDYNSVLVLEKPLHQPPLQELADVLSRALPATFAEVAVSVEPCPDLTQEPFALTSPGLSGNVKLLEVGGVPYLMPLVRRDKLYDLAALMRFLKRDSGFLAGAGAGPWPHVGVNCEGIINLSLRDGKVDQGSRIVTVEPKGAPKGKSTYKLHRLPNDETRTAVLGNYVLSDGKPGQVIKVVVKNRIGESNFITAVREAVAKHYGDKVVGLGGTFLLREGRVKHHVMPDFSAAPISSDAAVDAWLHYYEMRAPIVHLGTLVTGDLGLDLRVQHFHGYALQHGDGGHYHYDTTPREAHYEAYFSVAQGVVRVDPPQDSHGFGRD